MPQYVYFFGDGESGTATPRCANSWGAKGANLAEMTSIGLPVPAGFTISTEVCSYYYDNDRNFPPELRQEVEEAMRAVEGSHGGQVRRPERSPARVLPKRAPERACRG